MALTDNLLAYYKLGDTKDSLNTFNLNKIGTPRVGPGKLNNTFIFDGATQALSGGNVLGLSTGAWTVSAWVKITNANTWRFIAGKSKSDAAGTWEIRAQVTTGVINVHFQNGSAVGDSLFGAVNVCDNNWHFVVGMRNGSNVLLYVDGIADGSVTDANVDCTNTNNFKVGADDAATPNFWLQGNVNDVGVWNRALDASEVSTLYNLGRGLSYPFTYNQFAFGVYDYNPYAQYQTDYWQTSFLQTIGRIKPGLPAGTVVSETEQETSQIIIDKVFQGQTAAVALSTVNLNMNISIPSPDAVLVVTGGSVIATGAKWASVTFNGNPLTNLVQAAVAGADAEIWYLPFPTVGTYTLSIASGSGGEIYANVMVILGVDKRSTNIMTASATDAASTTTISALITPDAPNSLIIDTLSTLNTTTFPTQDASQTQVFNATALVSNEYVLSTYKIASSQQNMNYNLSVAVNASLVAVAFRPAQAASMWFPNIDSRELDDVVTVNDLDAGTNPAFGNYGYKPSNFYLNSFFHTIGRQPPSSPAVVAATTKAAPSMMMMGVGM